MNNDLRRILDDDRMPWRHWRWVFGAVWLLFLFFPISAILDSDHSSAGRIAGLVLIAVFGLVYLGACVVFMSSAPGTGPGHRRTAWAGAAVLAVLAALALGLIPLIGVAAFGLAPFLIALSMFVLSRRAGTVVVVLIVTAAAVVPGLVGWDTDFSVVAIMVAVGASMIAMRAVRARENERIAAEDRQRVLNSELAVVAERERVARDVHDILGHSLTVISVKTELAGRLVDLDPDRAKAEMVEVNALARDALAEVRSAVGRLRVPMLPDGLAAASSALGAAGVDADVPAADSVSTPHAPIFAWVLREAVTNVVRHSGAAHCRVVVGDDAITIADDGEGSPLLVYGNGLRGLAERVEDAGGRLIVRSDASGTVVTASMDGARQEGATL